MRPSHAQNVALDASIGKIVPHLACAHHPARFCDAGQQARDVALDDIVNVPLDLCHDNAAIHDTAHISPTAKRQKMPATGRAIKMSIFLSLFSGFDAHVTGTFRPDHSPRPVMQMRRAALGCRQRQNHGSCADACPRAHNVTDRPHREARPRARIAGASCADGPAFLLPCRIICTMKSCNHRHAALTALRNTRFFRCHGWTTEKMPLIRA